MSFPDPAEYPSPGLYPGVQSTPTPASLSVDLPQFDGPFRLNPDGQVAVVEQDSPAEVGVAVLNILVCPQGANTTDPAFGVPSLLFGSLPVDLTDIQAAVTGQEPRARYSLAEIAAAVDLASETILVTASVPGVPTNT